MVHELVHVAQAAGRGAEAGGALMPGAPDSPAEHETQGIAAGTSAAVSPVERASARTVRRAPPEDAGAPPPRQVQQPPQQAAPGGVHRPYRGAR